MFTKIRYSSKFLRNIISFSCLQTQWKRYSCIISYLFICRYKYNTWIFNYVFLPTPLLILPFCHIVYENRAESQFKRSSCPADSSLSYKFHTRDLQAHHCIPDQPGFPYYLGSLVITAKMCSLLHQRFKPLPAGAVLDRVLRWRKHSLIWWGLFK